MGMHIKATPMRMLGVAIFAALFMTVIGGGAAKAKDLDGDYTLTQNMTEQIVVVANKTVVLDLNGCNITTTGEDAIVVEKGAMLTVKGAGTVEATGSGSWAALYNKAGEVVLDGGTYLKDDDKGSYYAILNHGGLTINDGVAVQMINGAGSSLIDNGYYNYANTTNDKLGHIPGLNYEKPTLTINGGAFDGGMNTVKNDDNGVLEINGGTFKNTTQVTVMNWNEATINGGTFNVTNGAALSNGGYGVDSVDRGIMTVNGGTFNSDSLLTENKGTDAYDSVQVNGGTFNIATVTMPGLMVQAPTITGGVFTNNDIELPALPDGYYAYILGDGSKLVTDQKVDFESDKFVLNLTMGGENGVLDLDDFVLQNAAISIERLDDGNVEMNGAEIIATHPGTVVVTVEFNGEVQTYVINIAAADETTDDDGEVTQPVDETTDAGNGDVTAPNTGSVVPQTSTANDSVSTLATITTAIVMLMMLAGVRAACREDI